MEIIKTTVAKAGGCNYCDKGKMDVTGLRLVYPYTTVYEVVGRSVISRFCPDCLSELKKTKIGDDDERRQSDTV